MSLVDPLGLEALNLETASEKEEGFYTAYSEYVNPENNWFDVMYNAAPILKMPQRYLHELIGMYSLDDAVNWGRTGEGGGGSNGTGGEDIKGETLEPEERLVQSKEEQKNTSDQKVDDDYTVITANNAPKETESATLINNSKEDVYAISESGKEIYVLKPGEKIFAAIDGVMTSAKGRENESYKTIGKAFIMGTTTVEKGGKVNFNSFKNPLGSKAPSDVGVGPLRIPTSWITYFAPKRSGDGEIIFLINKNL